MAEGTTAALEPPPFSGDRLFLLVTGSINAALVPYWLHWLRQLYPDVVTHVAVTRSAERFVQVEAVRHLVTGQVWRDTWEEPGLPGGSHIGIDPMTDCYGIFPATVDSVMRLAGGACDSPAMMTLQMTSKPIAICASFPGTNAVIEHHLDRLRLRPNVAFAGAVPAYSVGKKSWSGQTGFFMPSLLATLDGLLERDAADEAGAAGRSTA